MSPPARTRRCTVASREHAADDEQHPALPRHDPHDRDHQGAHDHGHGHPHDHGHAPGHAGHSHGLVDRSILRSRAGIKAVSISLAVLSVTAALQAAIYALTTSVALLADLIHNAGDALTAIPLGLAFFFRSARGERWAGLGVVLAILVSAAVALVQTILRFIHPHTPAHLWWLAAAGLVGFVGNEVAAQIRLAAGKRLASPALIADGKHARIDGLVSLSVVASALVVGLGLPIADPVIGLVITLVILRIHARVLAHCGARRARRLRPGLASPAASRGSRARSSRLRPVAGAFQGGQGRGLRSSRAGARPRCP